ncbi:MAG: VOC family protein [Planctomycetes bacterium]|nr:VOC family protein [Planctomycetota bacterium]
MFDKFSHVMLMAEDVIRAVNWYKTVLGFTENFVAETFYASLRHDEMGCRIDLHHVDNRQGIGVGPVPYFQTSKFDDALAKLSAQGVQVGTPRTEGSSMRFVDFRDSEGNILGLQEAL